MNLMIHVLQVKGAPSLTAVIEVPIICEDFLLKKIAKYVYRFLISQEIYLTKLALIFTDNGEYLFKFYQVKEMHKTVYLLDKCNCGNSMMASAYILKQKYAIKECISLKNVDTKMHMRLLFDSNYINIYIDSLAGKKIPDILGNEMTLSINNGGVGKEISVIYLNVLNPYIILDARNLEISDFDELIRLNKIEKPNIFITVSEIRKNVAKKLGFSEETEFPKIAVILRRDSIICARTIYLDNWHKGLPITCMVTIVTALMNTVESKSGMVEKIVISPSGEHTVKIEYKNNIITRCMLYDFEIKDNQLTYELKYSI